MKIICTADEEEWIKNLMIESNGCALKCQCMLNDMDGKDVEEWGSN